MKLNEIADNDGARYKFKRVGRGIGSGKGKTAGRGVKGQLARSGVKGIRQFEGGQMPLYMRMPKRGFNKPNRAKYVEVNIGRIQTAIDAGKLDAKAKIDAAALIAAGVIRRGQDGVRLLGVGDLKYPITIEVAYATVGARKGVEKAGGAVTATESRETEEKPGPKKASKKGGKE